MRHVAVALGIVALVGLLATLEHVLLPLDWTPPRTAPSTEVASDDDAGDTGITHWLDLSARAAPPSPFDDWYVIAIGPGGRPMENLPFQGSVMTWGANGFSSWDLNRHFITDAEGRFSLARAPRTTDAAGNTVPASWSPLFRADVEIDSPETRLHLPDAKPIVARAVDSWTGKPLEVRWFDDQEPRVERVIGWVLGRRWARRDVAYHAPDGWASCPRPPDLGFTRWSGQESWGHRLDESEYGELMQTADAYVWTIAVHRSTTLVVSLENSDGRALAGEWLEGYALGERWAHRRLQADDDGRLRLEGVPYLAGEVPRLRWWDRQAELHVSFVSESGAQPPAEVHFRATERQRERRPYSGRPRGGKGTPDSEHAASLTIVGLDLEGGPLVGGQAVGLLRDDLFLGDDGRARVERPWAGHDDVWIVRHDITPTRAPLELVRDEHAEVVVRARAGRPLAVRVVDELGREVRGARVEVFLNVDWIDREILDGVLDFESFTGPDGVCRFDDVPVGAHVRTWYGSRGGRAIVPESGDVVLELGDPYR